MIPINPQIFCLFCFSFQIKKENKDHRQIINSGCQYRHWRLFKKKKFSLCLNIGEGMRERASVRASEREKEGVRALTYTMNMILLSLLYPLNIILIYIRMPFYIIIRCKLSHMLLYLLYEYHTVYMYPYNIRSSHLSLSNLSWQHRHNKSPVLMSIL